MYIVTQNVEDFTAQVRSELKAKFAVKLGVPVSTITLVVTASSARLSFTVTATDTVAGELIAAAMPTSTTAASDLLSTPTLRVEVTAVAEPPTVVALTPPGDSRLSAGAIAGIVGGTVGLALLLLIAFVCNAGRKGCSDPCGVPEKPVEFTSCTASCRTASDDDENKMTTHEGMIYK